MTGRPNGFKFVFRLLTVHRELTIYSIDSNGETLIRKLAILCVILLYSIRGASFLTGYAWGELSSEFGGSCLLNMGRVVLGRVFCLRASCFWGELSCFG